MEPTYQGLYYTELGRLVTEYVARLEPEAMQPQMDSLAMQTLAHIHEILENDDLNDSECYQKIDEIVSAFYFDLGVSSRRHQYDE